MIIRSWPFSDAHGETPLSVHAEPVGLNRTTTLSVDVRRGEVILTGKAALRGHVCRFQLGFWELTEPAPLEAFAGVRRINVAAAMVAAGLVRDLESHGRGYAVPLDELVDVLSRERMKELATMVEVMTT